MLIDARGYHEFSIWTPRLRQAAYATIAGAMAAGAPHLPETAAALGRRIRAGLVTAAETVAAALARAEASQPRLNAVAVPFYEEAAADARRLDRAGTAGLPLAGVPVSVKESLDLAGTPSSGGVEALTAARARADGRLVAALRAAGAVPIAKGNVAQLLWFAETENPVYGRTANPHALDRSPGGSSGGDAALVAAGVVPVAIGTDLGGSVRQPAHCCGIAALKPTAGRLSLEGSLDERLFASFPWIANQPGIFARDVADIELVLAALDAGAPAGIAPPRGLRVGVIVTNGVDDPSPSVRRAVALAAAAAEDAGAHVIPFAPPAADHALELSDAVFVSDGGETIERMLAGTAAHPRVAAAREAARGRALDTAGADALARRIAAYRRSFAATLDAEGLDAVLGPVHSVPAVRHGTSHEVVRGQSYASLWNLLGYPAGVAPVTAVVPAEDTAAVGLPVGAQIAARPWREDVVLGLLAAVAAPAPAAPHRPIADV
ncbi:MAG TPA: amidase family protein [Gaiellales bacterium]|nr:amidase family protein [Gaiellales bacterium]